MNLDSAYKNTLEISSIASELLGPLHNLAKTKNQTNQTLVTVTAIEIDTELDRPMNPNDYEVTIRYTVANKLDSPREVRLKNFDYIYIDVAAERISRAVRNDICELFGLPPAFGEYILIAV